MGTIIEGRKQRKMPRNKDNTSKTEILIEFRYDWHFSKYLCFVFFTFKSTHIQEYCLRQLKSQMKLTFDNNLVEKHIKNGQNREKWYNFTVFGSFLILPFWALYINNCHSWAYPTNCTDV